MKFLWGLPTLFYLHKYRLSAYEDHLLRFWSLVEPLLLEFWSLVEPLLLRLWSLVEPLLLRFWSLVEPLEPLLLLISWISVEPLRSWSLVEPRRDVFGVFGLEVLSLGGPAFVSGSSFLIWDNLKILVINVWSRNERVCR